MLRRQRDAVGLSFIDSSLALHTPAKLAHSHAQMLYNHLYTTLHEASIEQSFQKQTNLAATLHQVAEAVHKRSLIILFSDFFEDTNYEEVFAACNIYVTISTK